MNFMYSFNSYIYSIYLHLWSIVQVPLLHGLIEHLSRDKDNDTVLVKYVGQEVENNTLS